MPTPWRDHVARLTIAGVLPILIGCGSTPVAPSPDPTPTNPPPSSTTLTIAASEPMETVPFPLPLRPHIWSVAGQTAQMRALSGSTDVTAQAEWSATGDFATLTSTGVLTAHRGGNFPLRVTYQGRTTSTFVTVFNAPPTTRVSFTGVLGPGGRRPHFVTVGAGGGDVVFHVTSAGSRLDPLGIMFGTGTAGSCAPPYTYGTNWFQFASGSGVETEARGASRQVLPGAYCVILLDPATITADDRLSSVLVAGLVPLTTPINYTLTIAASGSGASVVGGQ